MILDLIDHKPIGHEGWKEYNLSYMGMGHGAWGIRQA